MKSIDFKVNYIYGAKIKGCIMDKILILYVAVYVISILITVYGVFFNDSLVLSGVLLSVFITPPFIVYLYGRRNKYK